MLAERLAAKWGQSVVVENRTGAGATVGAEVVARSAPDGYTLFETTSAHTISASLYRRLPYDPIRDFSAITLTATGAAGAGGLEVCAGEQPARLHHLGEGAAAGPDRRLHR
jgi:tripartite-type tricarboxylate transporter receptor subunit TctC